MARHGIATNDHYITTACLALHWHFHGSSWVTMALAWTARAFPCLCHRIAAGYCGIAMGCCGSAIRWHGIVMAKTCHGKAIGCHCDAMVTHSDTMPHHGDNVHTPMAVPASAVQWSGHGSTMEFSWAVPWHHIIDIGLGQYHVNTAVIFMACNGISCRATPWHFHESQ